MKKLHIPIKKLEKRSYTRNHVFNLIFQLGFLKNFELEEIQEILNEYYNTIELEKQMEEITNENFIPLEMNKAIIENQLIGIATNLSNIDENIKNCSEGWEISRIDKVSLAILRLAIYEILFDNIPKNVVMNEAIELSKEYGTDKSYRFVNAVLGKI